MFLCSRVWLGWSSLQTIISGHLGLQTSQLLWKDSSAEFTHVFGLVSWVSAQGLCSSWTTGWRRPTVSPHVSSRHSSLHSNWLQQSKPLRRARERKYEQDRVRVFQMPVSEVTVTPGTLQCTPVCMPVLYDLRTVRMMEYVIPMLYYMVNINILCCIIFQLYGKYI